MSQKMVSNMHSNGIPRPDRSVPPSLKMPTSRSVHYSLRRTGIATRKGHRTCKRVQSGKQWEPIFFQHRFSADASLSEQCRTIYGFQASNNGQEDDNNKQGSVPDENGSHNDTCNAIEPRQSQQIDIDDQLEEKVVHMFLDDWEGSIPSWEAKIIRPFFSRKDDATSTSDDSVAWAWLDDREHATSRCRSYPNRMNAMDLCSALSKPRYQLDDSPNVDRRLIYISRLTPDFARALAMTAWQHQVTALRDAVCKHITMETSIRVHIPMIGARSFYLEFHLVYPILRKSNSSTPGTGTGNNTTIDLSFLNLEPTGPTSSSYSIRQANISVVTCGWSNSQWTGYAFANTGNVPEDDEEEEGDEDDEGFRQDFFAAEDGLDFARDANIVEWDVRKYWLRILAIRCGLVLKEWQYLVHAIEDGIKTWRANDPCNGSNSELDLDPKDIRKSLDWNIQTMQLLRTLRDTLSMTLRAYERFNEPGGDSCYFLDITDFTSTQNSIKETFEMLADIHSRLESLDASCKDFSTHLGRILDLESNRLTVESNKLNQDSNKLTMESHSLNERTLELNIRTSVIYDDMRKINEKNTEAACANQADAAKTSRSTRVNLEVLLFTTPLGMVLQYFGSDKAIFSFERNPKTFMLAVLIFMIGLRSFALIFEYADSLLRLVPWKGAKASRDNTPEPLTNQADGIELETVQSV